MFNYYFESNEIDEVVEFKKEALDNIREVLEADYEGNIYDLLDEVFNSGHYVIGKYKAKKILIETLDVFNVIDGIVQYEKDNFGEVVTNFSEPETVLNMFYYLIGENCIQTISNNTNLEFDEIEDDEDRKMLMSEIDNILDGFNQ